MSEADTWRERGSRQLFAGEWIQFDDVFRAVALVRPAELRAPRTTVAAMSGEATSEPDDESEWEVVTPERRIALFATDEVPALMLCAPTSWLPDAPAAPTSDGITSYTGPVLEHVDQIVETPQTRFEAPIPKPPQDHLCYAVLSAVFGQPPTTPAISSQCRRVMKPSSISGRRRWRPTSEILWAHGLVWTQGAAAAAA